MLLNVPKGLREELNQVLDALVAEGSVVMSKRGKYTIPQASVTVGTFSGNDKGFGFVAVEGRDGDVFIPAGRTGGAMHGDRVQIEVEPNGQGKKAEGTVVKVLFRANKTVV